MDKTTNNPQGQEEDSTFLEKIFSRLLETSPKFVQLNEDIQFVIKNVDKVVAASRDLENLATTVVALVKLVQTQQASIIELYSLQEQIMQLIKSQNEFPQFPLKGIKDEDIN
jgi:hypothetical protein